MMNIRLHIEYDGTDFHGWQRQLNKPTIQALIEDNLTEVVGKRVIVYGASRTDSGVHAQGQVAHFYVDSRIPGYQWSHVLNFRLPRTVRIQQSQEVPYGFHSQRDAIEKIYEYRVLNRDHASALDRRCHFYPGALDWEAMRAALPYLVGEHDFKCFQGAKAERKTTVRTISSFDLFQDAPGDFRFRIRGNGFLKQMVRTIVGTVLEVGEGRRKPESMQAILASRDRRQAGRTVPAHGLCLVSIKYPEFSFRQ